ncbi:YceI family protein [Streptomyces canus]|uniref:YceI family protein n=1 Tax=Streptomyces canus TaxID=58343 RepID=UPI003CEF5AAE
MYNRKDSTLSHAPPGEGLTGVYVIDPAHSTIGFSARHALVTDVRGKFTAFEGILKLDGSRLTRSEAYFSVQTGSADTGLPERDAHVRGPDFLDSATFPLMSFRSSGILDATDHRFHLAGHLRIKDAELPLRIGLAFGGASRDALGRDRVAFAGAATLRRSDRGLGRNAALAAGGGPVSDELELILDICAVRLNEAVAD